jgi:hypothetical protein
VAGKHGYPRCGVGLFGRFGGIEQATDCGGCPLPERNRAVYGSTFNGC